MKTLANALFLAVVVTSIGCGGPDRPELAAVSGKVMFNGQPVEGAEVVFRMEGTSRHATGTTGADGSYKLTTFEPADGAVPGEHSVTISKLKADQNVSSATADDPSAGYGSGMDSAATGGTVSGKDELPQKYSKPESSGLKRTVVNGESNEFNFDLK